MHLLNEGLKALFDIGVGEGRALAHIDELLAHHELFDLFSADLPVVGQVALVRHQANLHLVVRVVAQLCEPVVKIIKRFALSYIEYEQSAHRLPVMARRDAPVPLAARCVPDLRADHRVVRQHDSLCQELYSDRGRHPREDSFVVPANIPNTVSTLL